MHKSHEFESDFIGSVKSKPTSLIINPSVSKEQLLDFSEGVRDIYLLGNDIEDPNSSYRIFNVEELQLNFLHSFFQLVFKNEIQCQFISSLNPHACKLALNINRQLPHIINSKDSRDDAALTAAFYELVDKITTNGCKVIGVYLRDSTAQMVLKASEKYPEISFIQFYEDKSFRGLKSWNENNPQEFISPETKNRTLNPTPGFKAQLREFLINNVSRSVTIRDLSDNSIYPIIKGNGFHYHNEVNPLVLNVAYVSRDNLSACKSRAWESINEKFLYISLDEDISENLRTSIAGTYVYKRDGFDICTSIRDCPRITFIIATTGRRSIDRAIRSISDQDPFRYFPILMLSDTEPANGNELGRTSGLTRNKALDLIKSGWVSFLDDDDELAPGSLHKLYDYMNEYDMIVPRALYENGQILWSEPKMLGGNVGIWIFYNKTKFPDNRFPQGVYEDFRFVQSIEFAKAKILFLDEITYLVRPSFH